MNHPDAFQGSASFRARNPHLYSAVIAEKPSTRSDESEAALQSQIAAYLRSLKHRCYFVWHRTDRPSTCAVGTPDFIGVFEGRAFVIEVKVGARKATQEQNAALLCAHLAGARSGVARSVAEFVEIMEGKNE